MNTRKLFLTSLLAAATMSATAYAWTTGADGLPDTDGISETSTEIADEHIVTADTIYNFTDSGEDSSVSVTLSNGADVKLVADAADSMMVVSSITGDGDVWFAQGRWKITSSTNFTSGTIFVQGGQIWISGASAASNPTVFNNDFVLGTSSTTAGEGAFKNSSIRVNDNIKLAGQTTILNSGTTISFQNGQGITFSNLTGSGAIATSAFWGSASKLTISDANNFTGTIALATSITLDWSSSSSSATFGGLSGSGKVAGGSNLNIKDAQNTTFSGTVGAADNGVALALTGSGSQAFTGTNYFSTVSVGTDATLDLSGGTVTLGDAIQNSGIVTVSAGTVFNLTQTGTNTLITNIDSGSISGWNLLDASNFTYNGAAITVGRGLTSSSEGVVTYNADASAKILTWGGGTSGIWENARFVEESEKSWTSSDGNEVFYKGDSVTFGTENAEITVSGTVNPASMTVSQNTTFTGTDAMISVAQSALSIDTGAKLTLNQGVTLDLGKSTSLNYTAIAGTGVVKVDTTDTTGHDIPLNLGSEFNGTLSVSGNLDWSTYSVGESATLELSRPTDTTFSAWSNSDKAVSQKVRFASDYTIQLGGGAITLNGDISAASGTTVTVVSGWSGNSNPRILTINGSVELTNVTINSSGYTDPTVEIAGAATITKLTKNTGTLKISGSESKNFTTLEILGGATTTVSGSNISIGTLKIGTAYGMDVSGSVTANSVNFSSASAELRVGGGGTLMLAGHDALGYSAGGLDTTGKIILQGSSASSIAKLVIADTGTMTLSKEIKLNGYAELAHTGSSTFNTWGGKITATGTNNVVSSTIQLRKAFTVDVTSDGDELLISGVLSAHAEAEKSLVKTGSGRLTLSGNNSYTGGTTIEGGVLVAASASALGSGAVAVAADAKLGLVAGTTVTVTNGIDLASGAKLVVDLSSKASATETFTLDLVSGTALKYNGSAFDEDCTSLISEGIVVLENMNLEGWTQSLSYSGNTLQLTLTIPEPSTFGLLAGLGALALAGTRRRRRKA